MKLSERVHDASKKLAEHAAFSVVLLPLHSGLLWLVAIVATYFATTGRALIYQNPVLTAAVAFATFPALALLLWGVVVRVRKRKEHRRRHAENELIRAMATNSGLVGFCYQDRQPDISDRWAECAANLAKGTEISIAVFTGAETFIRAGDPLFDFLNSYTGRIRILLVKPDSPAFRQRIEDLSGGDPHEATQYEERFRRQLNDAHVFVRSLRRSPALSVECRAYDHRPIWRMVMGSQYLWVQHYRRRETVFKTPAYIFSRHPASSLYYPLEHVFNSRWAAANKSLLFLRDENGHVIDNMPDGAARPEVA